MKWKIVVRLTGLGTPNQINSKSRPTRRRRERGRSARLIKESGRSVKAGAISWPKPTPYLFLFPFPLLGNLLIVVGSFALEEWKGRRRKACPTRIALFAYKLRWYISSSLPFSNWDLLSMQGFLGEILSEFYLGNYWWNGWQKKKKTFPPFFALLSVFCAIYGRSKVKFEIRKSILFADANKSWYFECIL